MSNLPSYDNNFARIQLEYFSCSTDKPFSYPVVLLHGWGVDSRIWEPLVPLLQSYGDVIVVDVVNYSNDMNVMMQHITGAIGERAFYIGWSLGGMIATKIALAYPEHVAGLITLASNQQFVADPQWPYGLEKNIFDAFYQQLEKDIQENTHHTLRHFMGLVAKGDQQCREHRRYLKVFQTTPRHTSPSLLNGLQLLQCIRYSFDEVTVPRHHFFGEHDLFVPQQAVNVIKGDHVDSFVTLLEGAGHLLHYPVERLSLLLLKILSQWSEHD